MDPIRTHIVLCRPEESGNIGSVCRAMATGGMTGLRIIGNKKDYDETRIRILSIHAFHIWENARFYSSITEATQDCAIAAGTTRRSGRKRKGKLLLPEELADLCASMPDTDMAIVFGNERTGLTDAELAECSVAATIPSSSDFASLNLSHAVQIFSYVFFRKAVKRSSGYIPIDRMRLNTTVTAIGDALQKIGFFSVTGRSDMERFWESVLARAALSEGEAQYIEKIFDKAAGLSCRTGRRDDTE